MKKDYTRAELQAEMTALQQIFDSVTVADPFQGLLDPATLQPLNKVATIPVLDDTGRGMQVVQGTTGLETVLAQGITVESRPCVLLLQIPVPRGLQSEGDADAFARTLHQMQEDLRHDNVTGAYNAVYLNEEFRPIAEHAAMNGQPVGAVMVRVNEYWQLREHESASAADCCLNMAAGILQLAVGPDHDKAVLARLNDGFFVVISVGTPAAQMKKLVREAMENSRREFNISLSRRGSFTVAVASSEWGETASWDLMLSLAQQRL